VFPARSARTSSCARSALTTRPLHLLILSGQVAIDDNGDLIAPGDVAAQAERIFELIAGILEADGTTFANVLHIRTFMTNLDDLPAYGRVRRGYLPGTPPASTTVGVSRLFLPGAVLEVEVTAAAPATTTGHRPCTAPPPTVKRLPYSSEVQQ
jgi:2-iminobutanoate/2-iminopropanoate deaminase